MKEGNWEKRIRYLPPPFRKRITRFRRINPQFDDVHLDYELLCCEEAIKIEKAIKRFRKNMTYEDVKKQVPNLGRGHSGNSFWVSFDLAKCYRQHPELISKIHGAMCALTGCEEWGCWAAYPRWK